MNILIHFIKSTASGFFLVIGCCVLLASDNLYIGAALFTVALCAICSLGIPLYTGAAGFAESLKDFGTLAITLLGNMAGCAILGLLVSVALPEVSSAAAVLTERRVYPPHIAFVLSFACGILMYTAVYTFKYKNSYVGIFTCIPAFIICGFEHSIAYMGYMALGRTVTPEVLLNMLVLIIGNGIGAILLNFMVKAWRKNK